MTEESSSGYIEVDLFPKEVDSLVHPEVIRIIQLLEDVAEEYHCNLVYFDIKEGTIIFSFDSDELTSEIVKVLQDEGES